MSKKNGRKKRKATSGTQQEPQRKVIRYTENMGEEVKSDPDRQLSENASLSSCSTELLTSTDSFRAWCDSSPVVSPGFEKILSGVTFSGSKKHLAYVAESRNRYIYTILLIQVLDIQKNAQIWTERFGSIIKTSQIFEWKMNVRNVLLEEFRNLFYENQHVNLWAVGSTVNGCGSFNSDMDLCLVIPDLDANAPYQIERTKCLRYLRKMQNSFKNKPAMKKLIRRSEVPIIKVDLCKPYEELDLDININNVAGVYNSHLIHYYSRIDQRFPALCLLVKHWAIRNEISDAMTGTFNSYSLILLVLHYLQCGVQPAVLPNLQYLMPALFNMHTPLEDLELFRELEGLPETLANCMPIGDLLMGFFHYYHAFDFANYAISIRKGAKFSRNEIERGVNNKYYIFIEEPFDNINTARCVVKGFYYEKIREAFKTAHNVLLDGPPDLSRLSVHM